MSIRALEILRDITDSITDVPAGTKLKIEQQLHPYLATLIRELIDKYPKGVCELYTTRKHYYILGPNQPKLAKMEYSPREERDGGLVDIETFLKKEIVYPDNVLNLVRNIMSEEIEYRIRLTGKSTKECGLHGEQ